MTTTDIKRDSDNATLVRPIGFYVWTEEYNYAFRNKLHGTREEAEAALAGIVWHNRHNFKVRPVFIGGVP
jgi:hypothetical protein